MIKEMTTQYIATRETVSSPLNNSINGTIPTGVITPVKKSSNSTIIWIIVAIIVVILIIIIIVYIFGFSATNNSVIPIVDNRSPVFAVTDLGAISSGQTIVPSNNALIVASPTGNQTLTIAPSTNNSVGSLLGIKNTSSSSTLSIIPGTNVVITNTTIAALSYAEFVLTSPNKYVRLV